MKYRVGFVTNSSSSSFILAFSNRSEINNLNVSERVLKALNDEEYQVELSEILNEYREYWEENLWCDLYWEIATIVKIDTSEVEDWINNHPEEYKKIYDEIYKRECETRVQELEEKLKGKELIFSINEGDEWNSYDEYQKMEQLCGVMDYH